MKRNFSALTYHKFKKSVISLFFLGLVVPVIHILTLENGEMLDIKYVIVPIVISLILILVVRFSRKVLLGKLMVYDMDFWTLYELEKRKPNKKYKYYNLKLLSNAYFFSGDFQHMNSCLVEILKSCKEEYVCYARHLQIITLFITGDYKEIPNLISLQEKNLSDIKNTDFQDYREYYSFIKLFMEFELQEAITIMNKLLSQKNMGILNCKKVLIYYFLRMSYMSLGDVEKVQICTNEIARCDPKRLTFFQDGFNTER